MYGSYQTNLFPGAATYTYAIEVPKGTNNLQPFISINYNSQSVKQRPGIIGAGWSISQNYIYRDVNSTPDNTTDDRFMLVFNGGSYEFVYDQNDTFYHTKIESFLRIQNLTGAPNTYSGYWVVTTKDGTQFRFGYNSDSELTSNTGKSYALRWSLDQVTDAHDNKIFYSYLEDPNSGDSGTSYPSQIIYNNDRKRNIDFVYESSSRPDLRTVYDQGNKLNETRRLSSINISVDNILVRTYQFEYGNLNSEKSLSSLAKIKFIGADNSSVLHQITFDYYPDITNYVKQTSVWTPPVSFSVDGSDKGIRTVDLDNDGFLDIIQSEFAGSVKNVWINDKKGSWVSSNLFSAPEFIVDVTASDNGIRFVDFNNDGLVDMLQGINSTKAAWYNNGIGWTIISQWAPPISFISAGADQGVQLVDFDGDGKVDILQAHNNGGANIKKAYRNNGVGWEDVSSEWTSPTFFYADKDTGARIEDLNGDGLPDIIESSDFGSVVKNVWINNANGWTSSPNWNPPVAFTTTARPDNGVRFNDVNGDGLTDITVDYLNASTTERGAWINNGVGWTQNNTWQSPEPFTRDGRNIGRRLADINGDGFAGIIVAHRYPNGTTELFVWTRNTSTPYMLRSITTELGRIISVSYANSTNFDNAGNDSVSDIGFNMFVVKNVSYNNSLTGPFTSFFNYSYNYSDGKYDYEEKDFRGFSIVNETLPDSSIISHRFYQDEILKGKEYNTTIYNSSGNIFTRDEALFNYTNASAGYFKVFTVSQTNYLHDGAVGNPKVTNVTYSYDSFGNVIYRSFLGDVNATGDEKYENYSYVINTSAWIVDKLSWYLLFDSNNQKVRETKYHYDGQVYGRNATKGDVTAVENWNDKGANPITRFEYDRFGNVIRVTDPLYRETSYTYGLRDTTFTFVDKITNALDHQTDFKYDLGTGNLLWKKQNGIYTYFVYDTFGRLIKEIQPFDSNELPTKSYNYSFDGTAPESIKISQRTTANKTFDTYFYYDGLGNFIQFKKPSDGNQQIVKNLFYDGMERVRAESNPYFAPTSAGLTTTHNSDFINYTYDTLSRVISVRNPDGNTTNITFNHWNVTAYDENGHMKTYVTDSYGRIINVLEYNNNPVLHFNFEIDIYTTNYNYDTADNLIKITDALGNNFIFGYDSLGRRISLQDPDLGNWSYTYDLIGNLIRQVQNGGGNLVTGDGYYREYNELNQLTIIRNGSTITSPQLENYTYDPFGQRIKIMRNDTVNTTIYTPFKELMRIVNSSGNYDFTYIYDGNTLVARVNPDASKYYYHSDHLGSTSLITDQNGNVVENTFYSPYGELLGGGTADVKLYTSQFKDFSCEYYYGARYYNPCLGIFTQSDSYQSFYNPQGLNRFSYGLNNPYKYTDSSGNCPMCIAAAAGALIGGGIDLGVQLWHNNGDLSKVSWSEVGVSAVAGGIGGLTFGAGTAVFGTGFGATVLSGAGAGIAGGQTSIAGGNFITGMPLTQGLGQPKDLLIEGLGGGGGAALGYGVNKMFTSVSTISNKPSDFKVSKSSPLAMSTNPDILPKPMTTPQGKTFSGDYHDTIVVDKSGPVKIHGTVRTYPETGEYRTEIYSRTIEQSNGQSNILENIWRWLSGKT